MDFISIKSLSHAENSVLNLWINILMLLIWQELPKGNWFCCMDCSRIHSTLQKLLIRGAEKLPDSLLNDIKKKHEEKGLNISNNIDVRWTLLSGKIASPENKLLLSRALSIFQVSTAHALWNISLAIDRHCSCIV